MRFALALKSMYDDQSQRRLARALPVAKTKHLDVPFHVEKALFPRWQFVPPWKEISHDRLGMAPGERPPGLK